MIGLFHVHAQTNACEKDVTILFTTCVGCFYFVAPKKIKHIRHRLACFACNHGKEAIHLFRIKFKRMLVGLLFQRFNKLVDVCWEFLSSK